MKHFAVIGSGVAGLAAARRLRERIPSEKAKITLFDPEGSGAGIIQTDVQEPFNLDWGPENFFLQSPTVYQQFKNWKLLEDAIFRNTAFPQTYIARNKRLWPLPKGFRFIGPSALTPVLFSASLSFSARLRLMLEPLIPRHIHTEDKSIESFLSRRLGALAYRQLVEPLILSVYGMSGECISARSVFKSYVEMVENDGSIYRGMRRRLKRSKGKKSTLPLGRFMTFPGGMQEIRSKILPENIIIQPEKVLALEFTEQAWNLRTEKKDVRFDGVILALPSKAAATIIKTEKLKTILEEQSFRDSKLVYAKLKSHSTQIPKDAGGVVFSRSEDDLLQAISFNNRKYPKKETEETEPGLLLRIILNPKAELSEGFEERLKSRLETYLGPLELDWVKTRAMNQVSPVYAPGHSLWLSRLDAVSKTLPGLALCGKSYRGVGVPECLMSGVGAADQLADALGGE